MLTLEKAQTLALQALAWLAQESDRFDPFLAQSGTDLSELRARAGEPELLASVMDYLLSDEAMVLAFAGETGIDPSLVLRARASLPGGDVPFWT